MFPNDNILHLFSHLLIDVLLLERAEILQCEPGAILVLGNCHEVCAGVEQHLIGDWNYKLFVLCLVPESQFHILIKKAY